MLSQLSYSSVWSDILYRSSNRPPRNPRHLIINFPLIPSLSDLVSGILINQYGLDVEFGEHPASMTGLWITCTARNWPFLAETGPIPMSAGGKNRLREHRHEGACHGATKQKGTTSMPVTPQKHRTVPPLGHDLHQAIPYPP